MKHTIHELIDDYHLPGLSTVQNRLRDTAAAVTGLGTSLLAGGIVELIGTAGAQGGEVALSSLVTTTIGVLALNSLENQAEQPL